MITISKTVFGLIEGREIFLFNIKSKNISASITNFGGIVTSLLVPGRDGQVKDVVLGFDNLQQYLDGHPYFGCIVGRYANRIGEARFNLDGKTFRLAATNGENHLHGGIKGFDRKIWEAKEFMSNGEAGIELSYTSPDGEEGYPGELKVRVVYSLSDSNELKIRYFAEASRATPINLTHHGYFNLDGEGSGDVLGHVVMIDSDHFTIVDDQMIPTGDFGEVSGTGLDFRQPRVLGKDISEMGMGYDHNFVLNNKGEFAKIATVRSPASGITMDVFTDQPGVQLYTGNFLDDSLTGKTGKAYQKHYGFCLETQHFPDSPNRPEFPNTILRPGKLFRSFTVYKFRD